MRTHHLATTAALALAVPAAALAAPAEAAVCCPSISVRVSDATPASGQTFRIRGRFLQPAGQPAVNRVVKVQARRNDSWVPLSGARVRTDDEGRYRMRLILSQRGRRLLRVVGVNPGDRPNAFRRFAVRVH